MKCAWLFFFCLFCLQLPAQLNLQSIVDRDPFDPNRGKLPEVFEEVVEEPPPPPPPPILPILDGTIIIGDAKIAILTNSEIIDAGQAKTERVGLNESFMGYTVSEIRPESVKLSSPSGATMEVRLYSGKKTQRGGSRIVQAPVQQGENQIISPNSGEAGEKPIGKPRLKPSPRPKPPTVARPQTGKPDRSNKF